MASEIPGHGKEVTARHLIVVFLVGVALCGVFFSLGFLVGYHEQSSKLAPVIENLTGSAVPPPTEPSEDRGSSRLKESTKTRDSTEVSIPAEVSHEPSPAAESSNQGTSPPSPPPSDSLSERPAVASSSSKVSAEVPRGYAVQVTALSGKRDAEALVSLLRGRGYPVFLVAPEYAHSNDNLFRVEVGPFTTRDEAQRVRAKLDRERLFKNLFIRR